jgi:hypothetical protein
LASLRRTLVLGALIFLMPFSGMRVVCLGTLPPPSAESKPIAAADPLTECERLCPLHQPVPEDDSDCALSAEGYSVIAFGGVALMETPAPPQAPDVPRAVFVETPRFAPEPELPRFGPPPKPQAL